MSRSDGLSAAKHWEANADIAIANMAGTRLLIHLSHQ
jgi:hypothetical protein